jgi:hypothetical protein
MTQAAASSIGVPSGALSDPEALSRAELPSAFLEALDDLKRLGLTQLRLLGGEPTRHPDFAWMLTRALERGFSVLVRSAGLVPHAVLKRLERLTPDQVTLLLPVVIPGEVWPHQLEQQAQLFSRLGPRVLTGINLLFPSVKLDYVLDWIDRYALSRRVRLELRPLGDDDPHGAARLVGDFARRAAARGVRLELDSDGGPALDLLPDGKVIFTGRCRPAAPLSPSAAGSRSCPDTAAAR